MAWRAQALRDFETGSLCAPVFFVGHPSRQLGRITNSAGLFLAREVHPSGFMWSTRRPRFVSENAKGLLFFVPRIHISRMRYLPHTEREIGEMLARIGAPELDALFSDIPGERRVAGLLDLPPSLAEPQLMRHLSELADGSSGARMLSFLGAGMYSHHVPPAVDQLLMRSEFYTAYTPYQGEVGQGTLQSMFEFQTMVSSLLGLDTANASLYDGASATAEAVLMARRVTKRRRILMSAGLHPHYRDTVRAYVTGLDGIELEQLASGEDGLVPLGSLEAALDDTVAAVVVGYPNMYGLVEAVDEIATKATAAGALTITATMEPYALALLRSPGELGADIAVAEGQALAVPPQFGGPGVGLFACRRKHVRQMPGRLIGETVDEHGHRGFVLTLATREQHIRREKATSNICTNHGLIALALTIRLALLGRQGFDAVARRCLDSSAYLRSEIEKLDGYSLPFASPTFNEFVVRRDGGSAEPLLAVLASRGVLGGVALSQLDDSLPESDFLVAVTELHERSDLDRLVTELRSIG